MSEPVAITVQLPEPAGADVQALAACELVLDQLHRQQGLPLDNDPHFKARVVAWLAEKYLDKRMTVSGQQKPLLTTMCALPECHNTSIGPCGALNCPKRSR